MLRERNHGQGEQPGGCCREISGIMGSLVPLLQVVLEKGEKAQLVDSPGAARIFSVRSPETHQKCYS